MGYGSWYANIVGFSSLQLPTCWNHRFYAYLQHSDFITVIYNITQDSNIKHELVNPHNIQSIPGHATIWIYIWDDSKSSPNGFSSHWDCFLAALAPPATKADPSGDSGVWVSLQPSGGWETGRLAANDGKLYLASESAHNWSEMLTAWLLLDHESSRRSICKDVLLEPHRTGRTW